MNFETMSKQRKMILIAAAVGVISMFLPWSSIVYVTGFHGVFFFVFLCFVAVGALAYMGDQTKNLTSTNWMITLIAGGLAALLMLINFFDVMGYLSLMGFGFYVALAASVAIPILAFMNRSATDSLQGGFDSLKTSFNAKSNEFHSNTTTTPTTTVSHTPTDEPTRPTP